MFEYKTQKDLFEFLNLEENPKCIVQILLTKLLHMQYCMALFGHHKIYCWSSQLFVTCDYINTIDNQIQLLIHIYVVQNWLQISVLLSFECMVAILGAHNLTQVLMQALMHEEVSQKI